MNKANIEPRDHWRDALIDGDCRKVEQMLSSNRTVLLDDFVSGLNTTPLHFASARGSHKLVAELLAARADVNALDRKGNTPLHIAGSKGHEQVMKALLADPRIEVDASNYSGETPLSAAVGGGENVVALLLADARLSSLNVKDRWDCTALEATIMFGNCKVAKMLLSQDDIEIDSFKGWGLMHMAIKKGSAELLQLLFEKTPLELQLGWVKKPDALGRNAFQQAIVHDQVSIGYELLHKCHTLLDDTDMLGQNALHIALSNGANKAIDMLIALRPQWVVQGVVSPRTGDTLLHLACSSEPPLSDCNFLRFWQVKRENVHVKNKDGYTPFELAVRSNNKPFAVEIMQPKVSFDHFIHALNACGRSGPSYGPLAPVVEADSCLLGVLNRDVTRVVYAYLGYFSEKQKQEELQVSAAVSAKKHNQKRKKLKFYRKN